MTKESVGLAKAISLVILEASLWINKRIQVKASEGATRFTFKRQITLNWSMQFITNIPSTNCPRIFGTFISVANIDVQARDFYPLLKQSLRHPLLLFCHLGAWYLNYNC